MIFERQLNLIGGNNSFRIFDNILRNLSHHIENFKFQANNFQSKFVCFRVWKSIKKFV